MLYLWLHCHNGLNGITFSNLLQKKVPHRVLRAAAGRVSDDRTDSICAAGWSGPVSPGLDGFIVRNEADAEVEQGSMIWLAPVDA
jgi:hypothetical protein